MSDFDPVEHPHRRFNPLTNEYVLVSPHRTKRPWLGHTEPPQTNTLPEYDPACYLCPGNARAGGEVNPAYENTFRFVNDYAAVLPGPAPKPPVPISPLMQAQPVQGACDVLVFHRRHDLTIARLGVGDIERIITEWKKIYEERGSQDDIRYVQIFENKGAIMGCSNPHPHGQVWSLSVVPTNPTKELQSMRDYAIAKTQGNQDGASGRSCMLCDYVRTELESMERIVVQNEDWVALVPWWAIWPFEILLLPSRRHVDSLLQLSPSETRSLADILSRVTKRYDNLFLCSFAYTMGIHQRPTPNPKQGEEDFCDFAHLHFHFEPPLLRSATVRKFLVGFEMMAEPGRDMTPEAAAARLRDCSEVHYLEQNHEGQT